MTRQTGDGLLFDRTRRELRKIDDKEEATITKEMFFAYITHTKNIWTMRHEIRTRLIIWIESEAARVRSWLTEIERKVPGFFDCPHQDTLIKLRLVSAPTRPLSSNPIVKAKPKVAVAVPLPGPARGAPDLTPFGTALPESVVNEFPELTGKRLQEVFVAHVQKAEKDMNIIRKWASDLVGTLAPEDALRPTIDGFRERLPMYDGEARVAQLCLDDVRQKQISHHEKIQRARAMAPMIDFNAVHEAPSSGDSRGTLSSGTVQESRKRVRTAEMDVYDVDAGLAEPNRPAKFVPIQPASMSSSSSATGNKAFSSTSFSHPFGQSESARTHMSGALHRSSLIMTISGSGATPGPTTAALSNLDINIASNNITDKRKSPSTFSNYHPVSSTPRFDSTCSGVNCLQKQRQGSGEQNRTHFDLRDEVVNKGKGAAVESDDDRDFDLFSIPGDDPFDNDYQPPSGEEEGTVVVATNISRNKTMARTPRREEQPKRASGFAEN